MSFTTFLQIDLFRSYNSFSQRICCYVDVMHKIWNEPIFLGLYLLTWPVILTMGINEKKLYLICMVCKKKLYLFNIKFFICLGLKSAGFVFLNPKAINRVGTINDAIYRPTEFVYCLRISLLPADLFIACGILSSLYSTLTPYSAF